MPRLRTNSNRDSLPVCSDLLDALPEKRARPASDSDDQPNAEAEDDISMVSSSHEARK